MQKKQLEAAASFVSDRLKYEPTGHDAAHIDRVRQLARQIANQEGGSLFVIEMAAIVHDIIDEKLSSEWKLSPQQLEHQLLFGKFIREIFVISWTSLQRCLFVIDISRIDQ